MKGAWVEAERVEEVRAAARGWKRAGAIGEGTFEEIFRLYPEPRVLPAAVWRVVAFVLVSFVLLLFSGAFAVAMPWRGSSGWILCAFLGAASLVLAELQNASASLVRRGGLEAASFWGIVLPIASLFLLLEETLHVREPAGPNLVLLGAALLFGAGAWRWGIPVFSGFSAAAVLVLLARAPFGRLLWFVAGTALALAAERLGERAALAPSHRATFGVLTLAGVAAAYAAANLWSLDEKTIESLGGARDVAGPDPLLRWTSIAATALVPAIVLVRGLKSRNRVLLDAGLVAAALSLVTLRVYLHIAATWVVLSAAGGALVLGALALNRWLSRGAERERGGFTAEPLYEDDESFRAVELAPVLAAHGASPRAPREGGFSGGGGSFGGGGAGSSY